MQVAADAVVSFEYTLTDAEGRVIDTSDGRKPLAYIHGAGHIVPGLETAMLGRQAGESFRVSVGPEEGYGVRDEGLVQVATRNQFPRGAEISVGTQFEASAPDGARVVTVVAIDGDRITLDANHPLAGATLHFAIRVVAVRPASAEELAHGHPHGEGDDHHH